MSSTASELRSDITSAMPTLLALTEADVAPKPAPGKWSRKEILGHLLDSASTNHQRFVRAQFTPDLLTLVYEPDAWVEAQRYQDAPWDELVDLWRFYNLHLARLMEALPDEQRSRPRRPHQLAHAGWCPVPEDQPATLEDLMKDYVGHLNHHLKAILSEA
jgi:hypothetical protein